MVKISVSILSQNNNETIKKLNETDADYLHIDAMDGEFVEPTHFSISRIKEVSEYSKKLLDIHLMVKKPLDYINQLPSTNIEYVTIHYEIMNADLTIIDTIKGHGIKCGLSVKPNTDIKDIFYLLDKLDLVLIMSVEPGYSGQDFMEDSLTKVKLLKEEIIKRNLNAVISIDGGINKATAKLCIEAGCDILVAGSYIVNTANYQQAINDLKNV